MPVLCVEMTFGDLDANDQLAMELEARSERAPILKVL
jgi:hypothetical protein